MNKIYLLAGLMIATITNAQNLYTTDGTLTANRTVRMDGRNLTFRPNSGSLFINGTNGNVGVNTITPTTKLEVNGDLSATSGHFTKSLSNGQTFSSWEERAKSSLVLSAGALLTPSSQIRCLSFYDLPQSNYDPAATVIFNIDNRNYNSRLRFVAVQDASSDFYLYDKNQSTNLIVSDDGNANINLTMPKVNSTVCIGTTSITDGVDNYSLSVNGNVRAKRVKVYTTWADYVFEKDYTLPTLEEVEQHIKEKGHLKDIPSAKEVEANGIELGEMNKLLLQKIEELTLYTIELNKEVQALKTQINKQ